MNLSHQRAGDDIAVLGKTTLDIERVSVEHEGHNGRGLFTHDCKIETAILTDEPGSTRLVPVPEYALSILLIEIQGTPRPISIPGPGERKDALALRRWSMARWHGCTRQQ